MSAEHVSAAIEQIIKPLAERHIPSVIAGGFMRDNALGRPWRDIDLYVKAAQYDEAEDFLKDEEDGWDEPGVAFEKGNPAYDHQLIMHQREFVGSHLVDPIKGARINLIGVMDGSMSVESVVSKFNLGICMIGTNGVGAYIDKRFTLDMADEEITLYRSEWGHEGSLKQWIKLQAKYPWPLRLAAAEPDWAAI